MLHLLIWMAAVAQEPEDALTEIRATRAVVDEMAESNPDLSDCLTPPRDALASLALVAEQVDTRRLESMAKGDAAKAALGERQLDVARVKARQLLTDAEACVPEEAEVITSRDGMPLVDGTVSELVDPEGDTIEPDPLNSSQFE